MNDYPESAVWDGAEGTAQVAFRIDTDGRVKNVTLVKSTGHDDLDAATLGCVGRCGPTNPATTRRHGGGSAVAGHGAVEDARLRGRHASLRALSCRDDRQLLAGIGGVTRISFRIMPDGTTKDAQVMRSSGNGELDQAAQRCIGERRFNTMRAVIPDAGFSEKTSRSTGATTSATPK